MCAIAFLKKVEIWNILVGIFPLDKYAINDYFMVPARAISWLCLFMLQTETALMHDAVWVFSQAVAALNDQNPGALTKYDSLSCETSTSWSFGEELLRYMKSVGESFTYWKQQDSLKLTPVTVLRIQNFAVCNFLACSCRGASYPICSQSI